MAPMTVATNTDKARRIANGTALGLSRSCRRRLGNVPVGAGVVRAELLQGGVAVTPPTHRAHGLRVRAVTRQSAAVGHDGQAAGAQRGARVARSVVAAVAAGWYSVPGRVGVHAQRVASQIAAQSGGPEGAVRARHSVLESPLVVRQLEKRWGGAHCSVAPGGPAGAGVPRVGCRRSATASMPATDRIACDHMS